jgi:maltooligosyltrehalose trehalohydrolase
MDLNQSMSTPRRLPMGAEFRDGEVNLRVWAPAARRVEAHFEAHRDSDTRVVELAPEGGGYFSGTAMVPVGTCYRFRLDDSDQLLPDPASRFQPTGPHGPSQVVDPAAFRWSDEAWPGVQPQGQVIYEMHIGAFTPAGTWQSAADQLDELKRLGVTLLEIMPIGEFPGKFGWGYDGVQLFAPYHEYGLPEDFRAFTDAAHAAGLGVILDVVYNHVGPEGNYLKFFAPEYFTDRYENDWGEAINFDGPDCGPVREFFVANAAYWIEEFHLDGFRLDATQQIFDSSKPHILTELIEAARQRAGRRSIIFVGENEPQHAHIVRKPGHGGFGADALWNDDFHHSAMVALTCRNEAYYSDYTGSPQEFTSSAKWGFLYQGQHYRWQKNRRGALAFDLPPEAFVNFIQNHDQVANSARGERVHALSSPGIFRAITALLLLGPATPMLFMGQEFGASAPFLYFADMPESLAREVEKGRRKFLSQFRTLAEPEVQRLLARPDDPRTFQRCKLDFAERERHREIYRLHKDLLELRRNDGRLRLQIPRGLDGAVLGNRAFVLRFFSSPAGDDRLLLINLGCDIRYDPAPEPLLAPTDGDPWKILWSSENVAYGGNGTPPLENEDGWWIPGAAAILLCPAAHRQP